jgi:hypothetical protein
MTKGTRSYGSPVALVMTRPRNCALKADGTKCGNKTRMAMVVPTRDEGEEMELSCVSLCGGCLEHSFTGLVKAAIKDGSTIFPFVSWEHVDQAVLEAVSRLSVVKAAGDPDAERKLRGD